MKTEKKLISELSLDPANVRKHSRKNLDSIVASLKKFGQQKPIIIDNKGIVLAGNGTLTAAKELGWTEINVIKTDLTGIDATGYAIADNRTSELAEWDEKLGDILTSLKNEGVNLIDIGFDENDLMKLLAPVVEINLGKTDANEEWKDMPEYIGVETSFRQIVIHFNEQKDVDLFFNTIAQTFTEKTKSIWFPEQERRDLKNQMWAEENKDKFDELR